MKNFKKVLALVLAIATLLSFATVASAKTADFADAKDVKNVEAVDVLSYIKVLEGYPADKSFKPAKNITREEAAKIIAIFANKSTDISSLYTSANPFADMKGRWGESYVAYGYRAGIIAGKNATSFVPKANVKGTEFLKMVLVVLGYDQNKEGLVGSSWAVNTLELAKAKKLLAGLGKDFDANAALTRDQAAQIMLNALKAEKVVYGQTVTNLVWNAKNGYWTIGNTTVAAAAVYVSPNGAQNNYAHELLAKDFGLTLDTAANDAWGRPAHKWTKGTTTIGTYTETPDKVYYTAVTECQVATDLGYTADKTLPVIVNGQSAGKYEIQRLDTVGAIGAQGRLTEIYDDVRIVMIDTFLAKVTKVVDATFDAAGHLKYPSKITLKIYDGGVAEETIALTNDSTNYTYVAGDYVLVNAYTQALNTVNASGEVETAEKKAHVEILGKAESFEGAQTVIWYNSDKHTVSGTTYDDAYKFILNKTTKNTNNMTWFKDQYGNLIGAAEIDAVYSYGVITSLRYAANVADNATDGTAKVIANVTYIDGTTNTITVSKVEGKPVAYSYNNVYFGLSGNYFYATPDYAVNEKEDAKTTGALANSQGNYINGHLMRFETLADGTVSVKKVATTAGVHTQATNAQTGISYGLLNTVDNGTTAKNVKVDANTKFLVRGTSKNADGTYTYTAISGVKDFAKYSKTSTVTDYVLNAKGDYASVVYIVGDSDATTTKGFAFIVGSEFNTPVKDNDVEYYVVTLYTLAENGTDKETVKVKKADWTKKNTDNDGEIGKLLTADKSYGKLFYLTYSDGFVTDVKIVKVDGVEAAYKAGEIWAVGYDNVKDTGKASYGAEILTIPGYSYHVYEDITPVVGSLNNLAEKVIYVIRNEKNEVLKVYVVDNDTSKPSVTPDATTGTVVYQVQFVDQYNNKQGPVSTVATWTKAAVNDYTVPYGDLLSKVNAEATATVKDANWKNDAMATILIAGTNAADGTTESFKVVAGDTTYVTFTVKK